MWHQLINPLHNTGLSALIASLPIVILFTLLLSRKIEGYKACLITLVLGMEFAALSFGMPKELVVMSAFYGIISGWFPIGWIVFNAVFLYKISVKSGSFALVRNSIESITADRRLQALLIAFCFGAFLEGSAGFGAPVAITAGMLAGLGFEPLYAAGICLIANTAPVAFGGIGLPVITSGHLTNIDSSILSRMIAHQLPFIAFIIPLWLVLIISGVNGARKVIPAILVTGGSYAITMFLTASFLGPMLPDVLSAIVSISCLVLLLRIWHPDEVWRFPRERREVTVDTHQKHYSLRELIGAWTPFILLIIFVGNWGTPGIQAALNSVSVKIPFGILNNAIVIGNKPLPVSYTFTWLAAAGTAILFAATLSAILLQLSWKAYWQTGIETLQELWKPLATIGSIVGFAYVANFSGMSAAIGSALTATGYLFPFISPLIGWLGVFITGSDTSSNALFSTIQSQTAKSLGLNPVLTVGANSSGGVAAKMISPQSIAVATASTRQTGQEGNLFRFTVLHSFGLVLLICALTYIQAYYANWMIPSLKLSAAATAPASPTTQELAIICLSIFIISSLIFYTVCVKIRNMHGAEIKK